MPNEWLVAATVAPASVIGLLVSAAEAAWAGVLVLPRDQFIAFVAARADGEGALADLHQADLYLACGCAHAVPEALELFESGLMPEVTTATRKLRLSPDAQDEVRQIVREKVLVGSATAPPRILDYSGRGALSGWLRVVATRLSLNLLRDRAPVGPPVEDALLRVAAASGDPELTYLRAKHGGDLRLAVERAIGTLTTEARVLLRLRYVDELGTAAIARLYGKHQVTILRRLDRVLETVRLGTTRALEQMLGCGRAGASSIVNLALSQVELSVERWLALPPE
jgi:RNA polymerase sigma-70 factor (ECF subfamily)